jgi:hypothetical protein
MRAQSLFISQAWRANAVLRRGKENGQALTEFLVLAVALLPLFLLIPLIAKYQDISHKTRIASRYAAFDATIRNDSVNTWKSEAELANEVRRRFFTNADAPIKTGDVVANVEANQNQYWRDPRGGPLIRDFNSDVTLSFGPMGAASTHASGFTASSDGAPFVLHDQLGLQARGIYTANVAVVLANLPAGLKFYEPFDQINLAMQRGTTLLLDPWTARSPEQIETKIMSNAAIFPSGSLSAVSPAVDAVITAVDAPGLGRGPRLGQLDFWRDVVPDDRLKDGN